MSFKFLSLAGTCRGCRWFALCPAPAAPNSGTAVAAGFRGRWLGAKMWLSGGRELTVSLCLCDLVNREEPGCCFLLSASGESGRPQEGDS